MEDVVRCLTVGDHRGQIDWRTTRLTPPHDLVTERLDSQRCHRHVVPSLQVERHSLRQGGFHFSELCHVRRLQANESSRANTLDSRRIQRRPRPSVDIRDAWVKHCEDQYSGEDGTFSPAPKNAGRRFTAIHRSPPEALPACAPCISKSMKAAERT